MSMTIPRSKSFRVSAACRRYFDKDILIYCISKLMHLKNAGKPIGPKVRLTTHDLLVSTNKPTNNLGYERLEASLERLAGTVIKTTIETGEEATVSGFALISSFEYNRKGSMHADRLRYLEITLSEWLFRAIDSAEVLTIDRDYFRLRSPLDRRLYQLARKHCGSKEKWRIGIDKLQKKCGSKQERKHFTRHMRETAAADRLPEYRVELDGDLIVFWRRAGEGANAERANSVTAARGPAFGGLFLAAEPKKILISVRGDRAGAGPSRRAWMSIGWRTPTSPGPRVWKARAQRGCALPQLGGNLREEEPFAVSRRL